MTLAEKQDPASTVTPRYWVTQREVWLRVTTLPDGLRKALRARNEAATVLCVDTAAVWSLAGTAWHMGRASENLSLLKVYPAWLAFVKQHPFAQQVAPVSLGLCGDNPPCLKAAGRQLPAGQGSFEVFMSNERASTAWYAVDSQALAQMLAFTARQHTDLREPTQALQSADDVLALAERWLEASCPGWLMGWRDICRATDERTVIASLMPLVGVGHTMPLFSRKSVGSQLAAVAGQPLSWCLTFVLASKSAELI
jgi:hypothetical protein